MDMPTDNVNLIFNEISPKYDFLNSLSSLGLHRFWKMKAVNLLELRGGEKVADLACGTADIAIIVSKKGGTVYAIDRSDKMLAEASGKIKKRKIKNIEIIKADIANLDFPDNFFEKMIISFGLRNVNDKIKVLEEIFRVLKPGGRLVILDFFKPRNKILFFLYKIYLKNIIAFMGSFFINSAGDIYGYLFDSINNFYSKSELSEILDKKGFYNIFLKNLVGGIAAAHVAEKPI